MKQYFSFTNTVFALALTVFVIGFSAFSQKQKGSKYSFRKEPFSEDSDTTTFGKRNRNGTSWNFSQLDEQMKQLNLQMKNLDIKMKNLDLKKYQNEIDGAMKKIDVEKITAQIEKSRKSIDWETINNQVAENINISKLKMADVKKEMELVKADLLQHKTNLKLDTGKINADIENAMKSIADAREEINNLQEFTDVLEKDRLIDKSKAFKIEVKNGELYIDGKKQPKEVSDKYRQYYKRSDFTIDTNEENGIRI